MPARTRRFAVALLCLLWIGCAAKPSPQTLAETGSESAVRTINELLSVEVEERGKTTAVILGGTGAMSPNIFKLTDPDRIIVDLTDTKLGAVAPSIDVNKGGVGQITSNQFDDTKSSLSRVVIGLARPMEYQVESQGTKLAILVAQSPEGGEVSQTGLPEIPALPVLPMPGTTEAAATDALSAVPPTPAATEVAPTSPTEALPTAATQLVDIQYSSSATGTTVRMIGDGNIETYEDFTLKSPSRVVVDLVGVQNAYPGEKSIFLNTPEVASLRLGAKKGSVRVVLDSAAANAPAYTITRDGNALVMNIASTGVPQEATTEAAAPEAVPPPSLPPSSPVVVTGLGFKQIKEKNVSRLIISTSDPSVEYTTADLGPKKFSITLANSKLEKPSLKREFDTREFDTAILSVTPSMNQKSGTTEFVVELEQSVPYVVSREEGALNVDVEIPARILRKKDRTASKPAPAPMLPPEEAPAEVGALGSAPESGSEKPSAAIPELVMSAEDMTPSKEEEKPKAETKKDYRYVKEGFMSESMERGEALTEMGAILSGEYEGRKFSGRKISLDFKDADVRSIFRLIAEISKFNMIISDDVEGRVTIRLDDVPWDQAFAIILQTRGLWFERYGNIVRIAPADKLRREREMAAAAVRAAKAAKPLDVLFKPVSFAQASTLTKQVQSVLSERGTVDMDSRTNTLIIKDIRENLEKARKMVDILDTQTPQVTIESRIVEASTTFTRSFGITWGGNARFTAATGNPTGVFFPNSITVSPFSMNFPVEAGFINTQAAIKLGSINNIIDLDLGLALGEQEGQAKLISAPKVTVLDNKSATITAGTKIPFLTQTANAGSNVRFENAATTLTVTPHITNDGSILMNISATRSEPNFVQLVQGNPVIDTRNANTEVLVKSGNTTVLGGIYSTQTARNQSRLPFLGKIPILGALFRNYDKQLRRTELLIFVTPRIVGDEREAVRDIRD